MAAYTPTSHTPAPLVRLRAPVSRGLIAPALVAAAACGVTAAPQDSRHHTEAGAPFYAVVQSDRRHDHPGLGTLVVAGTTRLLIDAGEPEEPGLDARQVDTLLFTGLDRVTPARLAPLLAASRGNTDRALQVSGPSGTASLLQRSAAVLSARGTTTRAAAVADVRDADFEVGGGVTVRVLPMTDAHVAYVVRFDGRTMLVATEVVESCSLADLGEPIDLAIVRHSPGASAARFLASVQAGRAVLVQDGVTASVSGIREAYRGPIEFARAGATRVVVPRRIAERQVPQRAGATERRHLICS